MRLFLLWAASPTADYPWLAEADDSDLCLVFDWLALDHLATRRVPAIFVDDVLTWKDRSLLELRVENLVDQAMADPELAALRMGEQPLAEASEYDLRMEWTNALRCFTVVRRLAEGRRFEDVVAQPQCSSSTRWAAAEALAIEHLPSGNDADPWIPMYSRPASRKGWKALSVLLGRLTRQASLRRVRVAAFPGGKVGVALDQLSREQLYAAGVGVVSFRLLVHGRAARLALTKGIPIAVTESRPPRVEKLPTSRVPALQHDDDPTLDRLLQRILARVVEMNREAVAEANAATATLSRLDGCRALLLPTTAVGPARVLVRWADLQGLRCAVFQHGSYFHRRWDGGDSRAGTVFSWGQGVRSQLAELNPGQSNVPVGNPDVRPNRSHVGLSDRPRAVLFATTSSPYGSMLGLHGFCELYLCSVAPGLRFLQQAGVEVALRLHPSEQRWRYEELLRRLDLRLPIDQGGSFSAVAGRFDAVVSSMLSSVLFEAASMGLPVAFWLGGMPAGVRRRHLLKPLDRDLPMAFSDEHDFLSLARTMVERPAEFMTVGLAVADELRSYAEPFSSDAFLKGLLELGSTSAA